MYNLTFHPLFQLCTGGSSIPGPGLGPTDFQGSYLATPSVVEAHRKQVQLTSRSVKPPAADSLASLL